MERAFGFDTMEIGHPDYSFKPAKAIVALEQLCMEQALTATASSRSSTAPCPTWASTSGRTAPSPTRPTCCPRKIDEARETQMEAAEMCSDDMVYVCKRWTRSGADGIDFDTTASAGDAEFLATLQAVEELADDAPTSPSRWAWRPSSCSASTASSTYNGTRLAGMWPHQQVKVVEKAGAHIFGPVVNTTNTASRRPGTWPAP